MNNCHLFHDSLEGKMAADPLKNKKMLNKSTNFRQRASSGAAGVVVVVVVVVVV
jgi:hypothetical protein